MGNLTKTIRYAKKNGFWDAFYTAIERKKQLKEQYRYEPVSEEVLKEQRNKKLTAMPKVSILVPVYETDPAYLEALIESVLAQSYENWELVLADAGKSEQAEETAGQYQDARIQYHKLSKNRGISENSNAGLAYVSGEYVALLDHDDLITPDALFEMVKTAVEKDAENLPLLIYSDEDKCDENGEKFHSPHRKTDFNLDLFLTNNYICHFSMVRTDVIKKLGFRQDYDGAQDYDLFLRILLAVMRLSQGGKEGLGGRLDRMICHVPKVLYHWRCHESSTADHPESKMYAYEAGRRALEDWYRRMGIRASVEHGKHLGFYETKYAKNIFQCRPDIGVIGGKLTHANKVTGGAMNADGTVIYQGLPRKFSGYMNRGVLTQDVTALDLRCMKVCQEIRPLYLEYVARLSKGDPVALSLEFSELAREKGYFLLYMPTLEEKV